MLRPWSLLVACAATLLVVSGCDPDQPDPNYSSVTPTPSASSSSPTPTASGSPTDIPATGPNSSPGEVAPTEPANATAETAEGAQSFATYYFKMLDWSYAVNSSTLMTRFFDPQCTNCAKLSANLASTFDRGTVTGTRVVIKQIALVDNDGRSGAEFAVDGVVTVSAGQLSEAGTSAPIPAEPELTVTLWVKYVSDGWRVVTQAQAT